MTESNKWYLGVHTLLPHLQKKPEIFKHIPLLKLNNCKLPPFFIAVGDKRRVRNIVSFLEDGYILEDVILQYDQNPNIGRVSIGIGTYKGTPITVFEHQMGCGSCEIICRELLSPIVSSKEYKTNNKNYSMDCKYIIRVGSCGGINGKTTKKEEMIQLTDVIVADKNVGITGCILQSKTSLLNFLEKGDLKLHPEISKKLINNWYIHNTDLSLTQSLFQNVQKQTNKTILNTHLLSNYSKDSLYCETDEEKFIELRDNFNVGSTEMELDSILNVGEIFTKLGESIKVSMVCYSLSVIPGILFANVPKKQEHKSSKCAIIGALETLHEMSLKTNHPLENF
jgi:purine-nucleoside phosphorylase